MRQFTVLKPSGYAVITESDGSIVEADTLQCVHCGGHWQIQPGSGRIRGFCFKCNGPVCGPKCKECIPHEQWLENIEMGNAANFKPIISPGFSIVKEISPV